MSKRSVAVLLVILGFTLIRYASEARDAVLCGDKALSYETYLLRASKTKLAGTALSSRENLKTYLGAKLKNQPAFLEKLLIKLDGLRAAETWLSPLGAPETPVIAFELPAECKLAASVVLEGAEARAFPVFASLPSPEKRAAELRLAIQALDPARRAAPASDLAFVLLSDRANAERVAQAVKKFEDLSSIDADFRAQPHPLLGEFGPSSKQQSGLCPKTLRIDHDGARGLIADLELTEGTLRVRFEADPTDREIGGIEVKTSLGPKSAYAERGVSTPQEEKVTIEYDSQYGEVSVKMTSRRFTVPAVACWYKRGLAG